MEDLSMTRINLAKYGFVRWPEKDFSDDGNRFTCYKAGKNVRVSKHVFNGSVFLSIDSCVGKGTLPYEIYHTLPHYNAANWKYNGVSVESLTDDDLENFMAACLAYELEYEAAEASIKYPTLEEIQDKAVKLTTKSLLELTEIENLLSKYTLEAVAQFSPYEWKTVQEYLKHLMTNVKKFDPETFPAKIVGQSHSFDFVKPDYNMQESYWFRTLKDLFAKYDMN
jgi:hypothetical protein